MIRNIFVKVTVHCNREQERDDRRGGIAEPCGLLHDESTLHAKLSEALLILKNVLISALSRGVENCGHVAAECRVGDDGMIKPLQDLSQFKQVGTRWR